MGQQLALAALAEDADVEVQFLVPGVLPDTRNPSSISNALFWPDGTAHVGCTRIHSGIHTHTQTHKFIFKKVLRNGHIYE